MRIKNFKFITGFIIIGLILVAAVLSVLLYTNGPRVRIVEFEKDPKQTSVQENSIVRVSFDRLIEEKDYSELISFSPSVDFSVQTSSQSLIITLNENLESDTSYNLNITPEVFDQTGRKMKSEFNHDFTTQRAEYLYLQRNYGSDFVDGGGFFLDKEDHIIRSSTSSTESKILFSAPEINKFVASSSFLAVAVHGEDDDTLAILDLKTNKTEMYNLAIPGRVKNMAISPHGETVVYSIAPRIDKDQDSIDSKIKVESLSLTTGESINILSESGDSIESLAPIILNASGQVALIQDQNQAFYAVSPFNDFDPILIGTRVESFGFHKNSSEIIFRDLDNFSRYNVSASEEEEFTFSEDGFVQTVRGVGDSLFYSPIVYVKESRSSIRRHVEGVDQNYSDLLWSDEDHIDSSLVDFKPSNDGKILAIQLNPDSCRFDTISSNTQCRETRTLLYDHESSKEIETINGFDVVWIP